MMRIAIFCVCSVMCLLAGWPAHGVHVKADGFPWNLSLQGEHDKPVLDKLGEGFFMNVGPTGIRAEITAKHPAYFTVRFVFQDSPAAGKIKAGDIIVGANGHVMNVDHRFGRGNVTGWDGPMQEMAKLIEDSQGKDGKLELMIWPGGNRSNAKKVEVQIPAVGRFSSTFPFKCERSDKLMIQLCDFLANEHKRTGKFGRQHVHTASLLALMASGENKYSDLIRKEMAKYPSKQYSSLTEAGYQCWGYGLDGLVVGEYYRLSGDKKMIPVARSISTAVAESQSPIYGGFSHKPFPVITQRVANGGGAGYGPLSSVTGLIMLAQSTFKATGLDYAKNAYERMHQGYLTCWTGTGYIGYGMENWPHVVVEPTKQPDGNGGNTKGIGYAVPKGMDWLGTFKLANTQPKGAAEDTRWLRDPKEMDRAGVYQFDKNRYLVVRDMTIRDMNRLPKVRPDQVMHLFRSGCAALAYDIDNSGDKHWQSMSSIYAKACADNPTAILDGHASTLMHTLWGSLGAARSNEKAFLRYMQGMKWWFIMAQTHDGSFVPMPGRDYASSDSMYAGRSFPTATAALILSLKKRKLLITGASDASSNNRSGNPSDDSAKPAAPEPGQPDVAVASMLGEDFTVKHFEREARLLTGKTPYARVLDALDHAAEGGDAAAQEATEFAARLRRWLTEQHAAWTEQAKTTPATVLARSEDHIRRMTGLDSDDAQAFQAMIDQLGKDSDTRTLSRYIIKHDQIAELEAKRGPSDATMRQKDQVHAYLMKFVAKPGLSDRLQKEAQAIAAAIEASKG